MSWILRRLAAAGLPADPPRSFGYWALAAHLLTVWAIALSNAALGLAGLWSARHRPRLEWPRAAPLMLPLGFYALLEVASTVASVEPATSAPHLKGLLGLATLPLALLLVRGRRDVRLLVDLLLAAIVLMAAYGLGQYFFTDYGPLDNRIPGGFSHYMTFSGVLLVGFLLLLGRIASGDGWKRPWLWLAMATISTTLLLTLTRGAWIAAAVAVTAALLLRARRRAPVYLAALALAGSLAATVGPATWKERLGSIVDPRDESNYDRLSMLRAGFFMISERPLFGLGPGMVRHRYPIYRHPTAPRVWAAHLHNSFLQTAAERGLPALAAYLWLMIAGLALARRGYLQGGGARGEDADLYLGVMLGLLGFNLAGLFEANWQDSEIQRLVLFVLAVPYCLESGEKNLLRGVDADRHAVYIDPNETSMEVNRKCLRRTTQSPRFDHGI